MTVYAGERDTGATVTRYRLAERVVHMAGAVSYVYLLLSGLAFWTPALYWLAAVLGGGYVSRVLHPWMGIVFTLVVAWMVAEWQREMRTTDADRRWRKAIVHYIKNEDDQVPPAGRFNFGQKQFFWLMVWGALFLLLSGLVLWRPDLFPLIVRQIAVFVHAVATLVTIVGFIVHVYMGVFVVPGGIHAIVHGDVTEQWAAHHHELWDPERALSSPPRKRGSSVVDGT